MQVSGNTKPRTRLQSTGGSQQNVVHYCTPRYFPIQSQSQSQFRQDQCAPSQQPENKSCWGLLRYCAPYEYARHSAPHHQLALTRTSTRMSVSTQKTRHPRALVRTIWEQQSFPSGNLNLQTTTARHTTSQFNPPPAAERRGRKIKTRQEEKKPCLAR